MSPRSLTNAALQSDYTRPISRPGQYTNNYLRIIRHPAMMPYRIDLQETSDTGRHVLEDFIHATFKRAYGANVRHFLPHLMSLKNNQDELIAAVGFQPARKDPLFLEQYLDHPIEQVLSEKAGCDVQRCGVMEIGNLAVTTAGGARGLIIALTSYLKGAGFDWVVFTAVPSLINSFTKMGIELIPLAQAKKERLVTDSDQWGTYYDANPMVVAGNIKKGFDKLEQLFTLEQNMKLLETVWNHAYAAGYRRRKGYQIYCTKNKGI